MTSCDVTRRTFLVSGVAAAAGGAAGSGMPDAPVPPGSPMRSVAVLPAGAMDIGRFMSACTKCRLCVRKCPEKVLRPSRDPERYLLPEAGFEYGYCRPECTVCADVCPYGAIEPLTREEKLCTQTGYVAWHRDRCIAATEGVICTACERHCPAKAVKLVDGVPEVNIALCIGCGACENLCPARPLPAMTVEGLSVHRRIPSLLLG